MTNENLIDKIKKGDNAALRRIYQDFKLPFVRWMFQKFNMLEHDATELFQYSVVVLYDNIVQNKLTQLDGSLKTYLFAIGRNKAMELIRHQRKQYLVAENLLLNHVAGQNGNDDNQTEHLLKRMDQGLNILGDPGKTILVLFYYNKMSMEEIAHTLNYKNAATVKNLKYKSIRRLQAICENLQLTTAYGPEIIRKGN